MHSTSHQSAAARRLSRALPVDIKVVGREATVAAAATAVLVLHLLDDNFIQPQPGSSARDHLVSGLVPIAFALAFAAAYLRMRAGLRGRRRSRSACSASPPERARPATTASRSARPGTTTPACSPSRPDSCSSASAPQHSGLRGTEAIASPDATYDDPCRGLSRQSPVTSSCFRSRSPTSSRTHREPLCRRHGLAPPTKTSASRQPTA